jgi:hypothetical protein
MKLFNKLATIVLGSSLLLSTPVSASEREDHQVLIDALESVGVEVVINHLEACDGDHHGWYSPSHAILAVCQDNASSISSREVRWTANDYDTLRHEAQHVIQDCVVGEVGDSESGLLFDDYEDLKSFVQGILSEREIENIIERYREQGSSDEDILRELEAFAVAKVASGTQVAEGVIKLCKV